MGNHLGAILCQAKLTVCTWTGRPNLHGLLVGFIKVLCALYALMALVLFIKPLYAHLHPVILLSETFGSQR